MSLWPKDPIFGPGPATYAKVGGQHGEEWRTDVLGAHDWMGNVFRLGDQVIYCVAAGRGQMMALGVVKQIQVRSAKVWNHITRTYDEHGWEFRVQVLTSRTSGSWDNTQRSKPAWPNPMNITSVTGFAISALVNHNGVS